MLEDDSPTHGWVASKIGFSIAGVSLLRSGKRQPSMEAMEKIEEAFDWPMCDQVGARHHYALGFERVIREAFEKESLDE